MAKKWGKKVEKSWETTQIKAFTHWVNTGAWQRARLQAAARSAQSCRTVSARV